MLADVLNNLGRLLVPRNKARAWQLGGPGPATGSAGRTFVLGGGTGSRQWLDSALADKRAA